MLAVMQHRLYILALPLLLTGCLYNQTGIQGDYESIRLSCQATAESKIDTYASPDRDVSEKGRNAELVTLFSDCMAKEGWQVATPKREVTGAKIATKTPTKKKDSATAKPAAPTPTDNPQAAPVKDGAVKTQSTPLSPSPSMPPLNPVKPAVNPNAATYQPATPGTNYYGSGPGRTF